MSSGDRRDCLTKPVDVYFLWEDGREIEVGEDQIRIDVIGATGGRRSVDDRFLQTGEG